MEILGPEVEDEQGVGGSTLTVVRMTEGMNAGDGTEMSDGLV